MTHQPLGGPPADYEKTDANLGTVTRVGIGIAVVALVVALLLLPIFRALEGRQARRDPATPPVGGFGAERQAPEPRLQGEPFGDWLELKARQEKLLAGYGWVDEEKGVTRVPIEQAMKMTIERGLPARSAQGPAPAPAPSAAPSPGVGGHP